MTRNDRYAASLQRRRENKAAEVQALVPRSLGPEERGDDVHVGPPVEVEAWVVIGDRSVRVHGFATNYTDRAVLVSWQGIDGESREAWVWSSAVTIVNS